MNDETARREKVGLLIWQVEMGADEAIGDVAVNRFAAAKETAAAAVRATPRAEPAAPVERSADRPPDSPVRPAPDPALPLEPADKVTASARDIAGACRTLADLRRALEEFEGCSLKHTATNLVFADGEAESGLMFVGEAPGAEEDRQGLPFVGASGKLLDRMLAAIGRDRSSAYISNILPWRPPGNRKPTTHETEICLPFIRRHIELAAPEVVVLLGGTAASTLLETSTGITRLRGRWQEFPAPNTAIPVMPTYHPAYLLRQPALKGDAWRDFLAIKNKLLSPG